jgi:hypothetical protein
MQKKKKKKKKKKLRRRYAATVNMYYYLEIPLPLATFTAASINPLAHIHCCSKQQEQVEKQSKNPPTREDDSAWPVL